MAAIFLSASVPDPKRGPEYAKTADTVAITAAVSSLLYVTLGRRPLVWGGHPAITPMIIVVAADMALDYGSWVTLYQSQFFEDEFPEDNQRFNNVVYTPAVAPPRKRRADRARSLTHMRQRMFHDNEFDAAVFIGGMEGIFEEFELFRKAQPNAVTIPVASTGGAALELAKNLPTLDADLTDDLDYVALFHRHLDVSVHEKRYSRRNEQPENLDERMWLVAPSKNTGPAVG